MSLMRQWQQQQAGRERVVVVKARRVGQSMVAGQQLAALLDDSLSEDLKRLSEVKSVATKAQLKRDTLIPKYADYVARLRTAGQAHDLIPYYMLWLFDAGEIEQGLDLGLYCVRAGLPMPEPFRRDVPITIADAVLEWSTGQHDQGGSPEPYFSTVFGFLDGMNAAEPWDLPDKLAAKYYRLAGYLEKDAGRCAAAVACLEQAAELGAPVKTMLAEARKASGETDA